MHKIYLDKRISNKKTIVQYVTYLFHNIPRIPRKRQDKISKILTNIEFIEKKKKNERDHYKQDLINFSINDSMKL